MEVIMSDQILNEKQDEQQDSISQNVKPASGEKYSLVVTNKKNNVETKFEIKKDVEIIIGADPEATIPIADHCCPVTKKIILVTY